MGDNLFSNTKALICDVDGVLTDGGILLSADGSETKQFNVRDGTGIKWLQRAGIIVGLITGRQSEVVNIRSRELGIQDDHVFQNAKVKLEAYEQLLSRLKMKDGDIAYIGDDDLDLPVMRRAGVAVAVADAVDRVKSAADFVTKTSGGRGAVRELCERILEDRGLLKEILSRYSD